MEYRSVSDVKIAARLASLATNPLGLHEGADRVLAAGSHRWPRQEYLHLPHARWLPVDAAL